VTLTFGSLFAGIGGLDLGLERAGMRCVWQVEINDHARRVLAKHWPAVRRWDDVRTFPPPEGEWGCGLVCGGFPRKQTSTAAAVHGRRAGLLGADSGLWREQLRILARLRPKWAVVENVAGVATWSREIQDGLEGLGYAVSRCPLTAAGLGAPHLRRRLFLVANAHGKRLEIAGAEGPRAAERFPWGAADGNAWLSSLPGVLRVDDGVPGGLDRRERITALGNAVVPAMAEWIGRRIVALSDTQ
jgi:DNA (cytosine-5)-methyltransferase 1